MIYMDVSREQSGRSDLWGLEALRTLVILNTAGLAGTITAYQIQAIPRITTPAVLFILGIATSFLAIALGWLLHHLVAARYQQNAVRDKDTLNPVDLFNVESRLYPCLNRASIGVGGISLGTFIAGAVNLILLLMPTA